MLNRNLLNDVLDNLHRKYDSYWSIRENYGFEIKSEEFQQYLKNNHLIADLTDTWKIKIKIDSEPYFEELVKNKTFLETAVFSDEHWKSFGIKDFTAALYGHKIEEIKVVHLLVVDKLNKDDKDINGYKFYYGFYSYKYKTIRNIYGSILQLQCAYNTSNFDWFADEGFPVKIKVK